jgi:hypothetical protein
MELEDGHARGSEGARRGGRFWNAGAALCSAGRATRRAPCRPSTTSKRAVDVGIILRASTGLSLGLAFNLPRNACWPGPLQELGR